MKAVRKIPSHATVLVLLAVAGCVPDSPPVTDPSVKNCAPFVLGICPQRPDSTCPLNLTVFHFGFGGALRRDTCKGAWKAGQGRGRSRRAVLAAKASATPLGAAALGPPFTVFPPEAEGHGPCIPA